MKALIFTFIIFFCLEGIYSQYERPPMPYQKVRLIGDHPLDTIPYVWYETDSIPEWNSLYNNAYNKINIYRRILTEDSFVYRVNQKSEYFKNMFLEGHLPNGCHIVKRNLYTGELKWQVHYSDKEAGRQEMLMTCRINDKKNLEIIGYRRARPTSTNNFQFGAFGINDRDLRLFFREYDGETGTLLQHLYPDTLDTEAAILKETSQTDNTLLYFTPNDTTIRYFEAIRGAGPQGVLSFLLNRNGRRISQIDTLITNDSQQDANVILTNENEYIVVEDYFAENEIYLHYFDLNMNKLKTKLIPNITRKGKLRMSHYKNNREYLELSISTNYTPPTYHWETFTLIVDLEGNVLDTFFVKARFSNFIYDKNRNLFWENIVWDETKQRWKNEFWIRPVGEDLRIFKSYTADSDYYAAFGRLFYVNDLLILPIYEKYNNFDPYDASSMMVVNPKDLGFPVFTKDVKTQHVNWEITPNPVFDNFDISFDTPQTGKLSIFDTSGSLIWQDNINNSQRENISVLSWKSGIYFVRFTSTDGGVSVKKLMKI